MEVLKNNVAELFILSWDQYCNLLDRERTGALVEEYSTTLKYGEVAINVLTSPPTIGFIQMPHDAIEDANYERIGVPVREFTNPNENLKVQLEEQITGYTTTHHFGTNLQESIECAAIMAMENFSPVDKSVVVKKSETEYLLAPYSSTDVVVRFYNPTMGTLLVWKPKSFVPFTLTPKSGAV